MNGSVRWSRILLIVGLVAMLAGILDPLEGSLVILAGTAVAIVGAWLGHIRNRTSLYTSFALVAVGVAALWGLSSLGGFGGNSRLSTWWGLLILPYPVGWILGLIAIRQLLRDPQMTGARTRA